MSRINDTYRLARERYHELGVDTELALEQLRGISLSLHCWQGDDVGGFETAAGLTGGGILATGNYPGRARNADELRADLELAYRMIPGRHRLNLHAIYLEAGGQQIARNEITPAHFARWIDWAKEHGLGMDFNPTFFSHPNAADGFTLAHADAAIRRFWIEHGVACRKIAEAMGRELGTVCVNNVWIPDGYKDVTIDRKGPRQRLAAALDEMFAEPADGGCLLDSVESKLFGIGSETYVVGSHDFYLGYAIRKRIALCLDAGHFHPTESVADKISSVLLYVPKLLLHVSRGVRWDSDHVVCLTDEVRALAEELVRGQYLDRTHIGLDFFDASINRIAAWVIGSRATLVALLRALLDPIDRLRQLERQGDFTARLALSEQAKVLPYSAVWDYYCQQQEVPTGSDWLEEVMAYDARVTSKRT